MKINESQNLKLISDYKDNHEYRSNFNKLAGLVFGIDFKPWYRAGFWSERYPCRSYAADTEVISNVSVNMMELICEQMHAAGAAKIIFMFNPDITAAGIKGVYNQRNYKFFIKPGTCKITGEFNFPRLSHA